MKQKMKHKMKIWKKTNKVKQDKTKSNILKSNQLNKVIIK